MEIREIPLQTIPVANLVTAQFGPGMSVVLPVNPSQFIYAQFKHIDAVPAPAGSQGFSLERLRMLDYLIDRLIAARGSGAYVREVSGLSSHELNLLISHYQSLLREAAPRSSSAVYEAGRAPGPGLLFNLVA